MWHWYHLRAQELIRERTAEADAWRQARAANAGRRAAARAHDRARDAQPDRKTR